MILSDSAKVLFLHVPRTGGSTITKILFDGLPDTKRVLSQHASTRTAPFSFFDQYSDYLKFTFVRNPWERIISWYSLLRETQEEKMKAIVSIEEFIETIKNYFWFNQLDYLTDEDGHLVVDKIGRYEDYENELTQILNDLNIPFRGIPRLNSTLQRDYRSLYTEKSKKIVEEYCYKDIDYFSYRF